MIKPKRGVNCTFSIPNAKLANYRSPEELSRWAYHYSKIMAHSDNHDLKKTTDINILDKNGHILGVISYHLDVNPKNTLIIITDLNSGQITSFKTALERYFTDVFGLVLP